MRVARKFAPTTTEAVVAGVGSITRARRVADVFCDGSADDVQVQALLDAGANVRLEGNFTLAAALVRKFPGQQISGAGIDNTTLTLANGVNDFAIKTALPSGLDRIWGGGVTGLTIDGNMANQSTGGGIKIDRGYFNTLEHLRILNTRGFGVQLIGTSGVYCAYNKLWNVSVATGLGHGIVVDEYSELNEVYGCNASYMQAGTIDADYFDEPPVDAGIGLYLKGGSNTIRGGHFDRCRVPIYLEFSSGNSLDTATDNALDCAVAVKGSHFNELRLRIGRMDPKEADGTTDNTRYGTRRAVNIVNVSAGNYGHIISLPDNNPPVSPPSTSLVGGWRNIVGQSSGAGLDAHGGPNVLTWSPTGTGPRIDGEGAPVKTKTSAYTVTQSDLGTPNRSRIILGDPTGGTFALTLPTAMKPGTYMLTVRNIAASNTVNVNAGASDSISGGNLALTAGQYATLVVVQLTNGAAATWYRVG